MKRILFTLSALLLVHVLNAQAFYEDECYVPETDPLVLEKVKQNTSQDRKTDFCLRK